MIFLGVRNQRAIGDSSIPDGTYVASQVLLDKHDPSRILKRMNTFFMKPDRSYELTGQVNNVYFLEGLAHFQGRWLLFYGTADSRIAVAVR